MITLRFGILWDTFGILNCTKQKSWSFPNHRTVLLQITDTGLIHKYWNYPDTYDTGSGLLKTHKQATTISSTAAARNKNHEGGSLVIFL
jgi:hypothetical protein